MGLQNVLVLALTIIFLTGSTGALTCYGCVVVKNGTPCGAFVNCTAQQSCHLKTTTQANNRGEFYIADCQDKATCQASPIIGRRDAGDSAYDKRSSNASMSDRCCNTNYCNPPPGAIAPPTPKPAGTHFIQLRTL